MNIVNLNKLNSNLGIGGWSNRPDAEHHVARSCGISTKSHVYQIGGVSTTGVVVNTCKMARLLSTGLIEDWTNGPELPEALACASSLIIGKAAYIFGGWNGSVNIDTVYKSIIEEDGRLDKWEAVGSLPANLSDATVILVGDTLILMGGIVYDGSTQDGIETYSDTIYYNKLTENMELGTWNNSDLKLPHPMANFTVVQTNTRIYVIGGANRDNITNDMYCSVISPVNELTTWVKDAEYPTELELGICINTKNVAFILGGSDIDGGLIYSRYATISMDGILGAFKEAEELPFTIINAIAFIDKTTISIVGGGDNCDCVISAPIDGWSSLV